jgi:hypothetical protein
MLLKSSGFGKGGWNIRLAFPSYLLSPSLISLDLVEYLCTGLVMWGNIEAPLFKNDNCPLL